MRVREHLAEGRFHWLRLYVVGGQDTERIGDGIGGGFLRLEGNDSESWNHLEVAHIGGRNLVAKLQRRDADQQVGERHSDALSSILAVDLAGPESHWNRHRMDRQSGHQFAEELPPRSLSLRRVCAGYSVR